MWRIASVFSILRRFLSHSLDRLGVHGLGLRLRLLVVIKADDNVISPLQVLKSDFLRFAGIGIVSRKRCFRAVCRAMLTEYGRLSRIPHSDCLISAICEYNFCVGKQSNRLLLTASA